MNFDLNRVLEGLVSSRRHSVTSAHHASFWYGVLQGLEPSGTRHSLHVLEAVYELKTRTIYAYWLIGDDSEIPLEIEIEPRPKAK